MCNQCGHERYEDPGAHGAVQCFSQERNLLPGWTQSLLSWVAAPAQALVTEIKTHRHNATKQESVISFLYGDACRPAVNHSGFFKRKIGLDCETLSTICLVALRIIESAVTSSLCLFYALWLYWNRIFYFFPRELCHMIWTFIFSCPISCFVRMSSMVINIKLIISW